MDLVELSLILILAVALIGAAARRVPIPAPLLFILGGAAYGEDGRDVSPRLASERAIRLAAVEAERAELQTLLKLGRINEQVLFVIQRDLDHLETVLQPRVEGA